MNVRTALAAAGITLGLIAGAYTVGAQRAAEAPQGVYVNQCGPDGQPTGDFDTCLDHDAKGLPFVTDGEHRLYVAAPGQRI